MQLDELEYESLLKVVEDRIDFELEKVECESANDELCAKLNSELISELKTLGILLDDWKLPKTAIKWNNSSTDVLKQPNSIHSVKNFLINKNFSIEKNKPCNPFRMINRRTDSTSDTPDNLQEPTVNYANQYSESMTTPVTPNLVKTSVIVQDTPNTNKLKEAEEKCQNFGDDEQESASYNDSDQENRGEEGEEDNLGDQTLVDKTEKSSRIGILKEKSPNMSNSMSNNTTSASLRTTTSNLSKKSVKIDDTLQERTFIAEDDEEEMRDFNDTNDITVLKRINSSIGTPLIGTPRRDSPINDEEEEEEGISFNSEPDSEPASRLMSGIASPSNLPDSPGQITPSWIYGNQRPSGKRLLFHQNLQINQNLQQNQDLHNMNRDAHLNSQQNSHPNSHNYQSIGMDSDNPINTDSITFSTHVQPITTNSYDYSNTPTIPTNTDEMKSFNDEGSTMSPYQLSELTQQSSQPSETGKNPAYGFSFSQALSFNNELHVVNVETPPRAAFGFFGQMQTLNEHDDKNGVNDENDELEVDQFGQNEEFDEKVDFDEIIDGENEDDDDFSSESSENGQDLLQQMIETTKPNQENGVTPNRSCPTSPDRNGTAGGSLSSPKVSSPSGAVERTTRRMKMQGLLKNVNEKVDDQKIDKMMQYIERTMEGKSVSVEKVKNGAGFQSNRSLDSIPVGLGESFGSGNLSGK